MDLDASHQPNKNVAVIGIIVFVFAVSLVVGIMFSQKNGASTGPNDQEAALQGDKTELIIKPQVTTLKKGESTQVSVMSSGTGSQATDVVLTFDPKLVAVSDVVNGDVFPDILRSEITEGQVVVSAAVDPNSPSDLKTGTIFSFTLEGVSAGAATLAFDKDVTITATNGVNTLGTAEAVVVTVQ